MMSLCSCLVALLFLLGLREELRFVGVVVGHEVMDVLDEELFSKSLEIFCFEDFVWDH